MGACSPPPIRQPRKHPLARINHASPGDGQVGARLTSQQVRTSSPHTVSQGWDPYLQVDEDGRHVRRAQHQPERGHVVLEERSPSAPEGRQSPSRPQSPVGGALTASEKNRRLQAAPPFPHQGSCGAAAHPAHGGAPRLLERGDLRGKCGTAWGSGLRTCPVGKPPQRAPCTWRWTSSTLRPARVGSAV